MYPLLVQQKRSISVQQSLYPSDPDSAPAAVVVAVAGLVCLAAVPAAVAADPDFGSGPADPDSAAVAAVVAVSAAPEPG